MKDERRPICEVVAESIERLIIDGVLKVGQPLPSERRLCEKLGFSRSICSVRSRERCTICSTFAHYWRANRQGWRQRWEPRLILL